MEKHVYNHYPMEKAKRDFEKCQKKRFRMTTIYFGYPRADRRRNQNRVQKVKYDMTLPELVRWIKSQDSHFPENEQDIVSIEPFPD